MDTQVKEHTMEIKISQSNVPVNPFKPSGVKWLHFEVFSAILV